MLLSSNWAFPKYLSAGRGPAVLEAPSPEEQTLAWAGLPCLCFVLFVGSLGILFVFYGWLFGLSVFFFFFFIRRNTARKTITGSLFTLPGGVEDL